MNRRALLGAAATAAPATLLAAPALAQSAPEIRWRLTSSFPRNLDILFGAPELIARRVAALTDNKFQIQVFAAGELIGGLQVLDAVQNATVECGYTLSSFYIGKDPTFMFEASVPFGLNTRHHNGWMIHGGGLQLVRDFMADYNIVNFPAGNTGAQMGGWFRKEINSVDDLKGLKFRIAGMGGQVLSRLGVVPQVLAGGDIYPALERGTLDAVEWAGPYDDEKLGFAKVARYYYYPGFWEGTAGTSLYVNKDKLATLPEAYRNVLEAACAEANLWCLSKYDAENPDALRRVIGQGAQLRAFPRDVLEASYKQAFQLYGEIAAQNPKFKKIYDHWSAFREKELTWFRIGEFPFDYFIYSQRN